MPDRFDDRDWAAVLKEHVDDNGLVAYGPLKDNREPLERFLRAVAGLDAKRLERRPEPEQIAFWINAYNAIAIEIILKNYPIRPARPMKEFPRSSIQQIPGVWDTLRFEVAGRPLSLNEIENEVLRKRFHEPRIHVALVCAARGCPPLRGEPYRGDRLDAQLDDQARRFLAKPDKLRIDRANGTVHLSSIFQWFGRDFVSQEGSESNSPYGEPEGAVIRFVSKYLSEQDRAYLAAKARRIRYIEYDWGLNEAPAR